MKAPIIVDADIDFVVFGPLLHGEGIIIRSPIVSTELKGIARGIYEKKNDFEDVVSFRVRRFWVKFPRHPNRNVKDSREVQLLFCWKIKKDHSSPKLKLPISFQKEPPQYTLRKIEAFIKNAYDYLHQQIFSSSPSSEGAKHNIAWHIEPVLYSMLLYNSIYG